MSDEGYEPGDKVYVELYLNTTKHSEFWQRIFKIEIKDIILCSYDNDPSLGELNTTLNGERGCMPAKRNIKSGFTLHQSLLYQTADLQFQREKHTADDLGNGWETIEKQHGNKVNDTYEKFSFVMQPLVSSKVFFLQMIVNLQLLTKWLNAAERTANANNDGENEIDFSEPTNKWIKDDTFVGNGNTQIQTRRMMQTQNLQNDRNLLSTSNSQHHKMDQITSMKTIHVMASGNLNGHSGNVFEQISNQINKQINNIVENEESIVNNGINLVAPNSVTTNTQQTESIKHKAFEYIIFIGLPIITIILIVLFSSLKSKLFKN